MQSASGIADLNLHRIGSGIAISINFNRCIGCIYFRRDQNCHLGFGGVDIPVNRSASAGAVIELHRSFIRFIDGRQVGTGYGNGRHSRLD